MFWFAVLITQNDDHKDDDDHCHDDDDNDYYVDNDGYDEYAVSLQLGSPSKKNTGLFGSFSLQGEGGSPQSQKFCDLTK